MFNKFPKLVSLQSELYVACNGVTNNSDCNDTSFGNLLNTYYIDGDQDGFGDPNSFPVLACLAPPLYVNNNLDCNDSNITFQDLDSDGLGVNIMVPCGVTNINDCNDNDPTNTIIAQATAIDFVISPSAPTICSSAAPVLINFIPQNPVYSAGCLYSNSGLYGDSTPNVCNEILPYIATTNGWGGEYSNINVIQNNTYTFSSILTYVSTVTPDYITVSNAANTVVYAAGFSPLTWTATTTATVHFFTHVDANCNISQTQRTRKVSCKSNPAVSLTPLAGLFTDAAGSIPYTGGLVTKIYAKPTATSTYTVNATTSRSCVVYSSVIVTVNQETIFYADNDNDGLGNLLISQTACLTSLAGFVTNSNDCDDNDPLNLIPPTTPTFNFTTTYCSGATIPALPLTSNNGITGTWNPSVIDALNSGTYVFTPNNQLCTATTSVTIIINPSFTPSIGLSTLSSTTICAGGSLSIGSQITNIGTNPTIKWFKDGNEILGENSLTLNQFNVTQSGLYTAQLTSNINCATSNVVTSLNSVFITVNPVILIPVTLTSTMPTTGICEGTAVTFTATSPVDIYNSTQMYSWKKNGIEIGTTIDVKTFTTANLMQDDVITVDMIWAVAVNCLQNPYTSNAITIMSAPNFTYYQDSDNDGFGDITTSIFACVQPNGYVVDSSDCDDNNANTHEAFAFYIDADSDGYGSANSLSVCAASPTSPPAGYSIFDNDCNDNNAAISPGKAEILYNGIDDNCDGNLDEGFQLKTKVQVVQCGTTLPTLTSTVYAKDVSYSSYRFRITNNTTNAIQTLVKANHWFRFNELASFDYGTSYTIEIEIQRLGIWLGYYGSPCIVNTPTAASVSGVTTLSSASCGTTLTSYGQSIFATLSTGVTGYKFRISGGTQPAEEITRTQQWFTLGMFPTFRTYGTTYTIEVAVKTTGLYTPYGASCTITTPSASPLKSGSCGATLTSKTNAINTTILAAATHYRFQITNSSNQIQVIDRVPAWFNLSQMPSGYAANATYLVKVAVETGNSGVYSPFSSACNITTPVTSTAKGNEVSTNDLLENIVTDFKVIALPNPFTTTFGFDIKPLTDQKVNFEIYDMIGKLLESREVQFNEVNNQSMGENYPSGIYNIKISQGENTQTIRVIKK